MPRKAKQVVIDIELVDIDRFYGRRSGREGVKVSCSEMTERIAFETEVDLQVLFGRVTQRNLPPHCHQNWPVENNQERRAYNNAGHHTPPRLPMAPRLCVIVLGHGAILLPPRCRAK